MKSIVIDTETLYSLKNTIQGTTPWAYVRRPDFGCYLVSGANDDIQFAAHPRDLQKQWKDLDGYTFIAHNASFDQAVVERLMELGELPKINIAGWIDTSGMTTYLQLRRDLAGAVKATFGEDLNKSIRDYMKGKTWEDAVADDKAKELTQYALDDSLWTWKLYRKLYSKWPELEMKISELTRKMGKRGLPIDVTYLEGAIEVLNKLLFEIRGRLPWIDMVDPKTKKPFAIYSKRALALECAKEGVVPPASLAKDSEACAQWLETNEGTWVAKLVTDMQNYQRVNKHQKSLKTIEDRLTDEDRMTYGLKYCGAVPTFRASGDAGFNVQNVPAKPKYGVDLRSVFRAPKGKVFVIADLSQIEPRLLAFVINDKKFLKFVRKGQSPYEAHARATMNWTGGILSEEDPDLYKLAKIRVLQLGYGCGWHRFYETVKMYGQLDILSRPIEKVDTNAFLAFAEKYTPNKLAPWPHLSGTEKMHWVNAFVQVQDFRESNPGIVEMWKEYDRGYKSNNDGGSFKVELLNGRKMKYFKIRPEGDGDSCVTQKFGTRRTWYYGSKILENRIQAEARNCFMEQMVNVDEAGHEIVLQVHDELVVEVDEDRAEESAKEIQTLLSTAPPWMKGCPLDCDYSITQCYTK